MILQESALDYRLDPQLQLHCSKEVSERHAYVHVHVHVHFSPDLKQSMCAHTTPTMFIRDGRWSSNWPTSAGWLLALLFSLFSFMRRFHKKNNLTAFGKRTPRLECEVR